MHCFKRLNPQCLQFALFFIAPCALSIPATAGNVLVQVLDKEGKPASDAVVVVVPTS